MLKFTNADALKLKRIALYNLADDSITDRVPNTNHLVPITEVYGLGIIGKDTVTGKLALFESSTVKVDSSAVRKLEKVNTVPGMPKCLIVDGKLYAELHFDNECKHLGLIKPDGIILADDMCEQNSDNIAELKGVDLTNLENIIGDIETSYITNSELEFIGPCYINCVSIADSKIEARNCYKFNAEYCIASELDISFADDLDPRGDLQYSMNTFSCTVSESSIILRCSKKCDCVTAHIVIEDVNGAKSSLYLRNIENDKSLSQIGISIYEHTETIIFLRDAIQFKIVLSGLFGDKENLGKIAVGSHLNIRIKDGRDILLLKRDIRVQFILDNASTSKEIANIIANIVATVETSINADNAVWYNEESNLISIKDTKIAIL